jgi:transcriptional regulator with PAS, ATPase and Fis domain
LAEIDLIGSELFGDDNRAFSGAERRLGRLEMAGGEPFFWMRLAKLRVLQEREPDRVGGAAAYYTNVRERHPRTGSVRGIRGIRVTHGHGV